MEPMSNLDAQLREGAAAPAGADSSAAVGAGGPTSTHDSQEAMAVADRIAVLDAAACSSGGTARELLPPTRPRCCGPVHRSGPDHVLQDRWQPAGRAAEHLPLLCGKVDCRIRVCESGKWGPPPPKRGGGPGGGGPQGAPKGAPKLAARHPSRRTPAGSCDAGRGRKKRGGPHFFFFFAIAVASPGEPQR